MKLIKTYLLFIAFLILFSIQRDKKNIAELLLKFNNVKRNKKLIRILNLVLQNYGVFFLVDAFVWGYTNKSLSIHDLFIKKISFFSWKQGYISHITAFYLCFFTASNFNMCDCTISKKNEKKEINLYTRYFSWYSKMYASLSFIYNKTSMFLF